MKIVTWSELGENERSYFLQRPAVNNDALSEKVLTIIDQVKKNGDKALFELTKKYDNVSLENIIVSEDEFEKAKGMVDKSIINSIKKAIARIENYQTQCLPKTITVDTKDGIVCKKVPRPISRVGLYVPGGSAPLVSTVMMLGIPAKIAGCKTRLLSTPPNANGLVDPVLLVCAKLCGIDTVCKVGGAQAIAAMAYGTSCIPKVDKIVGPGNAWVTAAKLLVASDPLGASIECPAGPSELLIIADQAANPTFVAADLLSQAEHGVDSQVFLITNSSSLAEKVCGLVESRLCALPRKAIAEKSLENSRIIVVDTLNDAFGISNQYAPEHLIIQTNSAEQYVDLVENAGAVFLGKWTPETMGDYITGSNHVLPTYGYANRYSALSVCDFMKTLSVQCVDKTALKQLGPTAMQLASIENLSAHKNAVAVRLQSLEELV